MAISRLTDLKGKKLVLTVKKQSRMTFVIDVKLSTLYVSFRHKLLQTSKWRNSIYDYHSHHYGRHVPRFAEKKSYVSGKKRSVLDVLNEPATWY